GPCRANASTPSAPVRSPRSYRAFGTGAARELRRIRMQAAATSLTASIERPERRLHGVAEERRFDVVLVDGAAHLAHAVLQRFERACDFLIAVRVRDRDPWNEHAPRDHFLMERRVQRRPRRAIGAGTNDLRIAVEADHAHVIGHAFCRGEVANALDELCAERPDVIADVLTLILLERCATRRETDGFRGVCLREEEHAAAVVAQTA